jgi:hypothetical protein
MPPNKERGGNGIPKQTGIAQFFKSVSTPCFEENRKENQRKKPVQPLPKKDLMSSLLRRPLLRKISKRF